MDALAEAPWYLDHLAPIWWALSPNERGTFYVRGDATARRARALGITPTAWDHSSGDLTLCAAYGDLRRAHEAVRRLVLAEHGAGQTYISNHPSYAGGEAPARDAVELFLVPGPTPAAKLRAAHPDATVVEIGSPRLDPWVTREPRRRNGRAIVAVSFHWDCTIVPETRWTFPAFGRAVQQLAKRNSFHVLGHAHPRVMDRLAPWYRRSGIEVVESFDEVLERADVYVVDNSSTLFEAAAAHIPVVVLNAPSYRRDVQHGLRFWDVATIGPQVDRAGELEPAVRRALAQHPEDIAERERCLDLVYTHRDGTSAARAASAIRALLHPRVSS